jgi:hypothetical protein
MTIAILSAVLALGAEKQAPIYQATVVARTTQAVNYGHRTLPTKVYLKGAVLYPEARGEASVVSRRGAVEIDAKFSGLDAPSRFGPGYLTRRAPASGTSGRGKVSLAHPESKGRMGRTKCSSHLRGRYSRGLKPAKPDGCGRA